MEITKTNKKAIVLLSGGLDSTTCLAYATDLQFEIYALSFIYGQKNKIEIEHAKQNAIDYQVCEHKIINIELNLFGGSSLTTSAQVERGRTREEIGHSIPSTYVPARNTIFLAYALAWADVISACDIFIGVNAVDGSGYPDCRPEYIEAFNKLSPLATKLGTEKKQAILIHTPLIYLSKSEIIKMGLKLGVDYSKTTTCYHPDESGNPCGQCDSCTLRANGFAELGLKDPKKT